VLGSQFSGLLGFIGLWVNKLVVRGLGNLRVTLLVVMGLGD
jgi:hypothetical protein